MKLHQFQLVILRGIATLLLLSCGLCLSAQGLSKKDLIGKWQSVNAANPTDMIFADSITAYFKTGGNLPVDNMALTYSVDSIFTDQ